VAALAVVAASSCSNGDDASAGTTAVPVTTAAPTTVPQGTTTLPATTAAPVATTVPSGEAFYVPPDPLSDGDPGDLLRARPFTRPDGTQAWQLLYRSENLAGEPVAVSGTLLVPPGTPPSGGRPVVSWANGTVGLADSCAESKRIASGGGGQVTALAAPLLATGMAVVATDYEGIGTPGVHPYLVGEIEGRNVLDAVRAVQQLPESGVTASSPVLVWGHSQGGHAAAFAAELAPTYAPELPVKGAALGAPPGDLAGLLSAPNDVPQPFFGFIPMLFAGYQAGYPDADLDTLLTARGEEAVAAAADQCVTETIQAFANAVPAEYLETAPVTSEPLASLLQENSAGRATPIPLFVYHGDADTIVNPVSSELMQSRYCAAGVTSERKVYPGADHTSVIPAAAADITAWFDARLVGAPAPSTCPTG